MAKATDIRWETDGYNVDLPTEMEIPSRFIDDDGIDEDAVSDWLSNTTGYLHSGFNIVDDWRTELFIASETDGLDSINIVMIISIKPGVDFKEAAIAATKEYCNTEEGKITFKENCGCFNWGDFNLSVPNSICEKYGIKKIQSFANAVELDYNQLLI